MHTDWYGVVCCPLALDQRQVQPLAGFVPEGVCGEFAKGGVERTAADFFNQ